MRDWRSGKSRLLLIFLLNIILFAPDWPAGEQKPEYLNAGQGQPPFDITNRSIPKNEILDGGPPKDGIPALDQPRFISAQEASRVLKDKDRVIGIYQNGEAKAYPLKVMVWHELVNDRIGGQPAAVSYCPLNGAGVVYDAQAGEKALTFGVTGKLYNSTVVLYDRQTQSLWSQIMQQAVAGPATGTRLRVLPSLSTSWVHWKSLYPETTVLSLETGFNRNYNENPYADYYATDRLMFPVPENVKSRLRNKERVIGLAINGMAKAYPFSVLKKKGTPIEDEVGGTTIRVHYDRKTETARITDLQENLLPAVTVFWFAWQAFHPGTEVHN
jgi:hypothetical protein